MDQLIVPVDSVDDHILLLQQVSYDFVVTLALNLVALLVIKALRLLLLRIIIRLIILLLISFLKLFELCQVLLAYFFS